MLSHVDAEGRPVMVDVGAKAVTRRTATARARVEFPPEVMAELISGHGGTELVGPKGPIFATAIVAGIQAAKRTWELIPMCHPLPIDRIDVACSLAGPNTVEVRCTVKTTHKTGVEMEALTGASVAALTIYDMTKALSHAIVIRAVELVEKTGGKSDFTSGGTDGR
jgi:cyclic pyranopterin phosphate synthase